jgi:hypothetical protein
VLAAQRLELVEGEVIHRVVYPHPLGRLREYAPAAALGAYSLLLFFALASPAGRGFVEWLDANTRPLSVAFLEAAWWLGLGASLAPFAWRPRNPWPLAYAVIVGAVGGFSATMVALPQSGASAVAPLLPAVTLLSVLPLLVLAEIRRTSSCWVLTNFRLIHRQGRIRPQEQAWRLTRLQRADIVPRKPRGLNLGDVVVAGKEGEARMEGVRPLHAIRDEVELLLHTSPEAPYLADQRDKTERLTRLLRGEP